MQAVKSLLCSGCGRAITSRSRAVLDAVALGHELRCVQCGGPHYRRRQSGKYNPARDMGCTVTVQLPDGELVVRHEGGKVWPALRSICDRLPAGSAVLSFSTHRTILRDLQGPRLIRGKTRVAGVYDPEAVLPAQVDPWKVERAALSRIGRSDLPLKKATFT